MHFSKTDLVLPLNCAENAFLEVLLSRFSLRRNGRGVELRVDFDEHTPATWNREGREAVRMKIPSFAHKAARYKLQLDEILFGQKRRAFSHNDSDFPFRWASAGALPVLNIGRKVYYCLFYRDVFPIGWNIANGATDNMDELMDPLQALEREVGEELVIVDPKREKRYVLRPDKDTLLERPEFAVFRKHWRTQYPDFDIARFRMAKLPLRWETAPDRVIVRGGGRGQHMLRDCFVNVNPADFGIELDRIARITVNKRLAICDGEVTQQRALNRPVGLFEVSRLQREIQEGRASFVPDRFYHSGRKHRGDDITKFLKETLFNEMKQWRRKPDLVRFRNTRDEERLRLRPVTASIIQRHMQSTIAVTTSKEEFDVFLSYATPDQPLAKRVFNGLRRNGLRVFFAPRNQTPGTWNSQIYAAIASAPALVSVATRLEHLDRSWPQYEINAFHMVHLGQPHTCMVPFLKNIEPRTLPLPLRGYEGITFANKEDFDRALLQLLQLLGMIRRTKTEQKK